MKIKIEQVSHQYKNVLALNQVNCELTPGIYGLIGPNGAGKSTLMRILVDIIAPTKGQVTYEDKNITTLGSQYRDVLGYLPQEFNGYSHFTAQQFLLYIANLKGMPKRAAVSQVESLLKLVGLEEAKKKKLKSFSGGMKRRVGLAQAFLNDPKILLLDEPTAGLDPSERIRLRGILSKMARNKIIILSTHIVSDIESIADQVLLLRRGELIEHATPHELLEKMKGRVWTVLLAEQEAQPLMEQYMVSNIHQQGAAIELRIVAYQKPHPNAIEAAPKLEDIYVYYFENPHQKEEPKEKTGRS